MYPNEAMRKIAIETDPEEFRSGDPCSLLMTSSGRLASYYAPFEFVNKNAKIVIVGITPGRVQAANALDALQKSFKATKEWDTALKSAKKYASFSGPMRNNLVRILDYIGVHNHLGISSCSDLFNTSNDLAHFTSLLRNPVLLGGKNYSGTPNPTSNPWLRCLASSTLFEEIQDITGKPIIVPLGPKVTDAMVELSDHNLENDDHFLSGAPHPSGANAERIAYFLDRKEKSALSRQTNPDSIDNSKSLLMKKVIRLSASLPNSIPSSSELNK
ncbi:uracil-DNA glycosylase family protein [Pelagimonas varians]|uniref:Uracil DNA glycosylase superfamily protein n=1 Tax=Pelagimonas varians TaxID=696760 RepID=A0A238KDY1_9RHOB|nr:uracil-DNA glycosylase family protein [Pelagimonas varians]PYG29949.1 uracil DNA glycosylase superfamily protein [Pelagimonas varians]SMX40674.1 Uracil DNA glycosylase superfamily protein [Pelagimonas varians]